MIIKSNQVIGQYRFLQRLGPENMGQVWKAQHVSLNKTVAIKTIGEKLRGNQAFLERFNREGLIGARLQHPNIVAVRDKFTSEDEIFIVMDYIPDGSLEDRLQEAQGRPLDLALVRCVSQGILAALNFANEHGVIHRDVKPPNILLSGERALLADFGIALPVADRRLTPIASNTLGSLHYLSPEQVRTPFDLDQRCDVYAFGCVLFEMLTGRPPFDAPAGSDGDYEIKKAHLQEEGRPRPSRFNPQVSERLDRVFMTATAVRREQRFAGCGEFLMYLLAALDGKSAPMATPAPDEPQSPTSPSPEQRATQKVRPPTQKPPTSETQPPKPPTLPDEPTPMSPEPLPPLVEPASKARYLSAIVVGWAIGLLVLAAEGSVNESSLLLALTANSVLCWFVMIVALWRAWAAIQGGHARRRPSTAVLPIFIPFIGLFFLYRALSQYPAELSSYLKRHEAEPFECDAGAFYLLLIALLLTGIPLVETLIPGMVLSGLMLPVVVWRLVDSVNHVAWQSDELHRAALEAAEPATQSRSMRLT